MSQQKTSVDQNKLEALYREHAEAEPDSGLDRIIRARAEQALATSRRPGPTPWIAGLATAGALGLAIGVVVLQAPPPATDLVQMERSEVPAGQGSARALRSAPMPAPAQPQADATSAVAVMAESAFIAELAEAAPEAAAQDLQDIRELLADGQTEAARARLAQLLENNPDLELPDELRRLLDAPPE